MRKSLLKEFGKQLLGSVFCIYAAVALFDEASRPIVFEEKDLIPISGPLSLLEKRDDEDDDGIYFRMNGSIHRFRLDGDRQESRNFLKENQVGSLVTVQIAPFDHNRADEQTYLGVQRITPIYGLSSQGKTYLKFQTPGWRDWVEKGAFWVLAVLLGLFGMMMLFVSLQDYLRKAHQIWLPIPLLDRIDWKGLFFRMKKRWRSSGTNRRYQNLSEEIRVQMWFQAAKEGDAKTICELKDCFDYETNLRDTTHPDGWTALHYAAYHGQSVVVWRLMNFGVNWTLRTLNSQKSALELARESGDPETIQVLEEKSQRSTNK